MGTRLAVAGVPRETTRPYILYVLQFRQVGAKYYDMAQVLRLCLSSESVLTPRPPCIRSDHIKQA